MKEFIHPRQKFKNLSFGILSLLLIAQSSWAGDLLGSLYDPTMQAVEAEMKVSVLKQQIIAHNLANKDTPGFVPVRFEEELQNIMGRPDYVKDKVIAEEEMAKMTKNRFRHQALLRLLNIKLDTVKKVINQGQG
jgi:flagellar basal body rod protein FlgB